MYVVIKKTYSYLRTLKKKMSVDGKWWMAGCGDSSKTVVALTIPSVFS